MLIPGLFRIRASGLNFKPLLKKQLITEQQYIRLLRHKDQRTPHSKILDDSTPDCLRAYIAANTDNPYNSTYFRQPYTEYTHREPYWIAENMDRPTREQVRKDHKTLLHCLYRCGLISDLTYEKIAQHTINGTIYKPWEIVAIAATLTEYEEALKKISIDPELKPLVKNGILPPGQVTTVINEILKGRINEKLEVIRRFGHKVSIPGSITSADAGKQMIKWLDACIELLPFYKSHTVRSVAPYETIDPHHKSYKLKYLAVTLVFNLKEYVLPVDVSDDYHRTTPDYGIGLFYTVLDHLCREHGDQFEVVILKDYFLGQRPAENVNIQFYHVLVLRKGYSPSFFLKEKMRTYADEALSFSRKNNLLSSLFDLLDKDRCSEADREFTYSNVLHSRIIDAATIPYFVPELIHILWYDILSDNHYTYHNILDELTRISQGRFRPSVVTDDFALVEDGETFTLGIELNGKAYSIGLIKGTVDYDLFRLLEQVQTENDLGGKFYISFDTHVQDGYPLVFLSAGEAERLKNSPLFRLQDLKTAFNPR